MIQRTLVILKPECLAHKHMGEVITRIERTGLTIIAGKIVHADRETAGNHYPNTRTERIASLGQRSIDNYKEYGLDILSDFDGEDPHKIGLQVRDWLIDMLTASHIFVMVVEGEHAIQSIRKLVGHTVPLLAQPGTIRGDFSTDSAYVSTTQKRPIKNMIHASGTEEEAVYEISLWFPDLQS